MKRRIFPLVATLALPLHARDLVPEYWLEDIPANDHSHQKCLVFRTVAGVGYRVESSANLESWQTDYQLYGMGHEFVVPVHEIARPRRPIRRKILLRHCRRRSTSPSSSSPRPRRRAARW